MTVIQDIKNNPAQYDLVIIGTPVWSSNMSTTIRTYRTRIRVNSVKWPSSVPKVVPEMKKPLKK